MRLESTIAERVETFVCHPVFAGSDRAMDLVLDDGLPHSAPAPDHESGLARKGDREIGG